MMKMMANVANLLLCECHREILIHDGSGRRHLSVSMHIFPRINKQGL